MRWSRSDTVRAIDGIAFTVGMLIPLFWLDARATEKPTPPVEQSQEQHQSQTVTAGGGQGGGASNQLAIGGDRSTAIAIGVPEARPHSDIPRCYLPGKGIKRVRGALWGVVQLDPVLVRDEQCMQDLSDERAHNVRMAELAVEAAKARAEQDRAALARMLAEDCRQECLAK
jgi:hypothetical protein